MVLKCVQKCLDSKYEEITYNHKLIHTQNHGISSAIFRAPEPNFYRKKSILWRSGGRLLISLKIDSQRAIVYARCPMRIFYVIYWRCFSNQIG
ncbi:hypothetical protein QE152_g5537 [Popillia japonica]|uniref:Uncharacterized protein n=1 Tax=Popillia japonica TaxID=7064 RepID=A0AAW1MLR0_POPJA